MKTEDITLQPVQVLGFSILAQKRISVNSSPKQGFQHFLMKNLEIQNLSEGANSQPQEANGSLGAKPPVAGGKSGLGGFMFRIF